MPETLTPQEGLRRLAGHLVDIGESSRYIKMADAAMRAWEADRVVVELARKLKDAALANDLKAIPKLIGKLDKALQDTEEL